MFPNKILVCLFCLLRLTKTIFSQDCINGPSALYQGTLNTTVEGLPCDVWISQPNNQQRLIPSDGGNHNYCRNPNDDVYGLWCYVTIQSQSFKRRCNFTKCNDESLLIFSNRDAAGKSWIASVPADPELSFTNQAKSVRYFYNSTDEGYIWALTADKTENKIFFTDFRYNQLNVLSMTENTTRHYLQGMCLGIEEIAFDWPTKNLYWTDIHKQWLMVADQTLSHYSKVYKRAFGGLNGLAIHSLKRVIVFSYYQSSTQTGIISCDLAGNNLTNLFENPDVHDVISITIDYNEDRLYWISNGYSSSVVMSSNLDGTDLSTVFKYPGRHFWGIAVYQDTIYLADQVPYTFKGFGNFFKMWIVNKNGIPRNSYRSSSKPKNLQIYSTSNGSHNNTLVLSNPCKAGSHPCEQICLPETGRNYRCACSLGYMEAKNTKCETKIINDVTMLIHDLMIETIFQAPLMYPEDEYLRIPIDAKFDVHVTAVALDPKKKILYWANVQSMGIFKSNLNGGEITKIFEDVHTRHLAVDPGTSNLYFVEASSGAIKVLFSSQNNGWVVKSLFQPASNDQYKTTGSLLVDYINKFVYWTAINYQSEEEDTYALGVLRRMALDGSRQETLLNNLHDPQALTINYERNSLFIGYNIRMVYEIDLFSIDDSNGQIPSNSIRHSIPGIYSSDPITELQVDGDFLFVGESSGKRILKFNLTDTQIGEDFGSFDFFHRKHLIINNSTYSNKFGFPSHGCDELHCDHLCLPSANGTSACDCGDDWKFRKNSNSSCIHHTVDDQPPTYDNCPEDMSVSYLYCQSGGIPLPHWQEPAWHDDVTAQSQLIITKPRKYSRYTPGIYRFYYQAVDQAGNSGQCTFKVTVKQEMCKLVPLPAGSSVTIGQPRCIKGDIVYPIMCHDESEWVSHGGWLNKTIFNLCLPTLQWLFPDYEQLSCKQPETTISITQTSTAILATTTPTTSEEKTSIKPSSTVKTSISTSNTTTTVTKTRIPTTRSLYNSNVVSDAKLNQGNEATEKPLGQASLKELDQNGIKIGMVILTVSILLGIACTVVIFMWRKNKLASPGWIDITMIWKRSRDQPLEDGNYQRF